MTTKPVTSWAVERTLANDTILRLGTVRWVGDGYRFISNVAHHRNSRKTHKTFAACLPRWVSYPDLCETRPLGNANVSPDMETRLRCELVERKIEIEQLKLANTRLEARIEKFEELLEGLRDWLGERADAGRDPYDVPNEEMLWHRNIRETLKEAR